ncbi:MAG: hypothetical protein Q4G27_04825 [Flavobacteriaceae bacterium]|nr:hypothetical protein [Flavobacteriaceae bacterium]
MSNRTNIDDFALNFMLSELNAKQFLSNHLSQFNNDKVAILERLDVLKDYFENNLHNKEFEDLQEIIIANIPINPNDFKLEKLTPAEQILYFDELKIEALEQRDKAFKELISSTIPNYINHYNKKETKAFDDGSIKGLSYKCKAENIVRFHTSLVRSGYIEVEYEDFKKFFKDRFMPNEKRIYWKKPLNHFYYLMQKIAETDKGKYFDFDRNNYLDIIPNMIEYKNKFTQEIESLSKEKYSRNDDKVKDTSLLDKSLKILLCFEN